jgi:hypothetical protein
MSIFNWLTGGGDSAKTVIDAVIKTGDALVFTPEEKSIANQKTLDWTLQYMNATNAQNVARRLIAIFVVGTWAIILLIACIAGYFNRDETSYAMWLFDVLKEIVANPYNIIIGFYFLTGTLRAFNSGGGK